MAKFFFNNSPFYRGMRHLSFFMLALFLFTLIVFFRSGKDDFLNSLLTTLVNAFFFFAYGYITIFVLIPNLLFKRFFLAFVLAFIFSGIVLSFLKLSFSGYIFASSISPGSIDEFRITGWRYMLINTKDMSFIVAVFAVAKYTKDWLYAERQRKMIESRNAEARLKLLQSQFDPHFLFNTLNNLYALSLKNDSQTIEIIQKLKKVIKYLLVDLQGNEVVLKEEIRLIKNYIYIEKIRYGERLKTEFKIKTDNSSARIAPMLFFPIIENCFKHGSSIDAGLPWMKFELTFNNDKLLFIARNSKPIQPSSSSIAKPGTGLESLQKRLGLLYMGKYVFDVEDLDKEYKVKLEINLK